jgi:hypothetical protein
MKYAYQAVERIPRPLSEGVVYHSEEFEVGALLCACGCGHRVSLLVPDSHQIFSEGGWATVTPSISVCDADCGSHYVITAGEVEWMPAFSNAAAASVMRRQIARHVVHEEKKLSWAARTRRAFARVFDRLKSILRI